MSRYWRLSTIPLDSPAQPLFAVVLVVVCWVVFTDASPSWSYHYLDYRGGPSQWSKLYPTCGQSRQSPVKLRSAQMALFSPFRGYLLDRTLVLHNVVLINNGHAADLLLPEGTYELSGGGLPSTYYAAAVHFHWGVINILGSEHVIPSNHHALEMHIIHYKSSYSSLQEAMSATEDPSALAVVGILFQANSLQGNDDFAPIDNAVKELRGRKPTDQDPVSTVIPRLNFGSLIGDAVRSGFYRYSGSLTTPPCSEIVLWTIFKQPVYISAEQVWPFRYLRDSHGHPLLHNIRPLQPLGSRTLFYSQNNIE